MTELVGSLLQNRYRIVKVLAQGGQSETFVAEDTHLPGHPECVVKHLKTANKDPERLANAKRLFEREAEVLQTQLCPRFDQIPNLLAYFELEGEFYLVQELIRGHPLSDEMPPGSRWAEGRVIELLRDMLWILNCIHQQGVIHRDLKPDNLIRRSRDQKLVLIDFGAVKTCVWEEERGHTIAIGTLGYMPFEQAMGEPLPASDLYALGMIAIQALTGVSPRQLPKVDDGEVCWQEQAPQVSEALARILTRMVRYRPSQRYQTALEVLEALQSFAPDQEAQARIALSTPQVSQTETQIQLSSSAPVREETMTHIGAAVAQVSSQNRSTLNGAGDPQGKATSLAGSEVLAPISKPDPHTDPTPPLQPPVAGVAIQPAPASVSPQIPAAPVPASTFPHRSGWRAKGALILSVVALSGLSTWGYTLWSEREDQFAAQLTLERMNTAMAARDFDQCEAHMAGIPVDQPFYPDLLERLGQCQLEQAQWLAEQGQWTEAIALTESLSSNLEIYPEAMQLQQDWTEHLRRQDLQQQLTEQGLASEVGIDYGPLSELMATGQWQAADQETDRILLRASGRQQQEFLDVAAIEVFPCTDLRTLDQLWQRLSGGQYGFTVQMMIWAKSGDTFQRFADRVDWREDGLYRSYGDLPFDPNRSEAATLPFAAVLRGEQMSLYREEAWWLYRERDHFEALFERLMECEMI